VEHNCEKWQKRCMSSGPKHAYCTTREAARLLEVSVKTAQLWVESGALRAWKTPGGHRRISRASVEQLLATRTASSRLAAGALGAAGERGEMGGARFAGAVPRLRVLIVEDDARLAHLYEITFASWGLPIDVGFAANGFAALLEIGKCKPHVLITDLRMPGMDGFRLISALCEEPYFRDVRIVAVSALTASDIRAAGGLPKDVTRLAKPIPFNTLRELIEDELAGAAPTTTATHAGAG